MYYGHSRPDQGPEHWESLEDHLKAVAGRAREFATAFGSGQLGELSGLWHDLGKYRSAFQDYLRKSSDPTAPDSSDKGRVDHSTAGAIHALRALGPGLGRVLAYVIAGHHAGLPDAVGGPASLTARLDQTDLLEEALASAIPETIRAPQIRPGAPLIHDFAGLHLWVRMLFSALVDADFLATEEFFDEARSHSRTSYAKPEALEPLLTRFLQTTFGQPSTDIAHRRAEVLAACRQAATLPPGLFSLSVPTGGGKTLSGTAFALRHAAEHGLRRVIYVIPFTTIAEQTADTLRHVFGSCVVEHHSNIDPEDADRETPRSRLSAENWDAPIIVTTNVQFFESFFASRTSRCRKLHNVAKSVVVLDEAQALPTAFLEPIRHLIRCLSRDYGVTFVFSTATQPALNFPGVREIVPDPRGLADALRRVRYEWPIASQPSSWREIAAEILALRQVLCVVGRRDDARALAELLPASTTIHLSALMCGAHRSESIRKIRERLALGDEIRVVSTQLVEAGVDLDFPVVFRSFAGLDSIAQAGGRANREGRLPHLGRVVVFHPPSQIPRGFLRKAADAARSTLGQRTPSSIELEDFDNYSRRLLSAVNSLDEHGVLDLVQRDANSGNIQFRSAAERFRLVDDSGYRSVLTWYGEGQVLAGRIDSAPPSRFLLRRLQRFVVSLPLHQLQQLMAGGAVTESRQVPGLFIQQHTALYHPRFGLLPTAPDFEPSELVI